MRGKKTKKSKLGNGILSHITDKEWKILWKSFSYLNRLKGKDLDNDKLTDKEFAKAVCFSGSASYGAKYENRVIELSGAKKVPAKLNMGDMKLGTNYIEIKSSMLLHDDSQLHVLHIRPYQPIDYYFLSAYDVRDIDNYQRYSYLLPIDDFKAEMTELKASYMNGTADKNKGENNREFRMSLNILEGDVHFERWNAKYRITDEVHLSTLVTQGYTTNTQEYVGFAPQDMAYDF